MASSYGNENSDTSLGIELLRAVSDHVSLQLSVFGVVLLVAGFFVQFVEVVWTNTGVWSAIMAIWGTALLVFGAAVYGLIWWSHQ